MSVNECGWCGATEPSDKNAGWAYKAEDLEGWDYQGDGMEAVLEGSSPLYCSLECAKSAALEATDSDQ